MTKREEIALLAASIYPGTNALQVEARADGTALEDVTNSENPIDAAIEIAHEIWRKVNSCGSK